MKPQESPRWTVLAALALAASCGGGNMPCSQASTSDTLPTGSGTWAVSYSASATGSGMLSSIQYVDATGALQTVPASGSSWTKALPALAGGMTVSIVAAGSPGNGMLSVSISSTQGGTQRLASNSCGGS